MLKATCVILQKNSMIRCVSFEPVNEKIWKIVHESKQYNILGTYMKRKRKKNNFEKRQFLKNLLIAVM